MREFIAIVLDKMIEDVVDSWNDFRTGPWGAIILSLLTFLAYIAASAVIGVFVYFLVLLLTVC